jgi:hypothetical protein
MATIHRSNRIYIFGVEINGSIWLSENIIDEFKNALIQNCPDVKFSVLKVQSVFSSKETQSNIHIDGIIYRGLQFLNVNDIDELRIYIRSGLEKYFNNIRISRIDIVNDIFYEDPTTGY